MLLYVLIAWSVTGDFKRSRWVYLRQIAWWITVFFFIGRVFNNFFFRLKRTGSSSFTLLAKYYHCRINFVNLFQLCVVIYLAFKVRVWSTSKQILTLSQIKQFSPPSFNPEQKFNTMSWTNSRISSDMKSM